jgi:class 3 adenylate cyclase
MRCANCGADNRETAKFCDGCGAQLAVKCPSCGTANRSSAKFCDSCGTGLATASSLTVAATSPTDILLNAGEAVAEATEGERKIVTALFADLKGSTELLESLDPEEGRAIVEPLLRIMSDAVRRYEGYVVRTTGDGIFALFGAPVAYEDHPQRALYAALQMQQELRAHVQAQAAKGRTALEARVGVHTGEVVAYAGEASGKVEYRLIGHTANLASRMESIARPGSIAISETTAKLCEGYFELRDLGSATVKGVNSPLSVYEVLRPGSLRTHFEVSARRGLTRFVGRQGELDQLAQTLEKAKAGYGQIVTVLGEAGVGKSRLFHEFKARATGECSILETFALSYAKPSAYLPVIQLLRTYFGIASEDDRRQRREKRIAKLLALDSSHVFSFWRRRAREKVSAKVLALDAQLQDTLPFLFSVLGIQEPSDPLAQMDSEIRRRRTLDAIKRLLLHESLERPLVLILEDLHWIDAETQSLLNVLADSIAHRPVLLLANYRPEYQHEWTNKSYYTQLRLEPLAADRAEEMLTTLLRADPELAALKQKIITRAEGNPFFIEEIVQALFEEGALVRNGSVKVTGSSSKLRLPATVNGILAARIDRLSPGHKELLQTAAAIGRESPLYLIRQIRPGAEAELERILADLQAAEFLHEKSVAGGLVYVFKHSLTLDVAYNSMLIERRKSLHEKIAQVLESVHAEELDAHASELAHHYSESDNAAKAIEYLERSGRQAIQRSAHNEAINDLTAALELLEKLPPGPERILRELSLRLILGPALIAVKGWAAPEVERAYSRSLEICRQVGETPQLFPTLFGLQAFYAHRAKLFTARELAERGLELARIVQDPALLLEANHMLGYNLLYLGELMLARQHAEEGISIYQPRYHSLAFLYGGDDPGVCCFSHRAVALWILGYPERALQSAGEALSLAERLSHPLSTALANVFIAMVHQLRGEREEALHSANAAITVSDEHGFPFFLALGTIVHGWALSEPGREEGIAQIRQGSAAYRATGAESFRLYQLALLAEALGIVERPV